MAVGPDAPEAVPAPARADAAGRMRARVERLQQVTSALASALTAGEIAAVIFDLGLELPKADAGTLCMIVEPGVVGMVYVHRAPADLVREYERFPVDAPLPVSHAVRTRRPVWLESPVEIERAYPEVAPAARELGHAAMAVLPLLGRDGEPLGALGVAYTQPHPFPAEDRAFLGALAYQAAIALDRARAYEAERAARAAAERVSEHQQKVMAVVGHDLRSPLQTITLSADLLRRRVGPSEQALVDRLQRAALQAKRILADLHDYGRAQRGLGLTVAPRPPDAAEIARRVVADHGGEGAGVTLEVRGDASLDGDPERLTQVLANLVGNALAHGAPPVRVTVEGAPAEVVLQVSNAGAPIPAAFLPRVFEPFTSGHADATGRTHSSGLGLYIVAELVKAHGGAVSATSTEADGTTFTVRLPRARRAASDPP
jgi:signal transduction histidine kinase